MNKIISFLIGAAIGSGATYFVVKKIIENKADEEIESVVKTFKQRYDKIENILSDEQKEQLGVFEIKKETKELSNEEKENIVENYETAIDKLGYSDGVDLSETQEAEIPFIISEEEYGEIGFEEETLILYDDGILTTEEDDLVTNTEYVVGDCYGDIVNSTDETVYVRNPLLEIDYAIIKSEKRYEDIAPEGDE